MFRSLKHASRLRSVAAMTGSRTKYTLSKVALSGSLVAGYVYHKHVYKSSKTVAMCEAVKVEAAVVKTDEMAKKEKLLSSLQKDLHKLMKSMHKATRYIYRLLTYLLYGIPLIGLIPVAYTIGRNY